LVLMGMLLVGQAEPARVTFTYVRAGMPVPQYEMSVGEDGTGRYVAKVASRDGSSPPQEVTQTFAVSAKTAGMIFETARGLNRFDTACQAKVKNVASTGAKTLAYAGGDGKGGCAYDYADSRQVQAVTNAFYGMAMTLDLGRKLEWDHRYDRLGLDKDMQSLTQLTASGGAIEPGAIAATLRSIAEDTQLLQRVRLRAAGLLEQVGGQ
jgi:hypothetical protein